MRLIQAVLLFAGGLLPLFAHAQAEVVGTVGLLTGSATALTSGAPARALSKGGEVYAGDELQTATGSYLLINFSDQGSVLLRPATRFKIEQYHLQSSAPAAAPAPPTETRAPSAAAPLSVSSAPESSFFRLLKGSLRAVSGLIGKRDYGNYRMSAGLAAPVATMGIRGTDYIAAICEADCAADATVRAAVPADADLNGAVVTGVYDGQVVVTSSTGAATTLNAGQYVITLANGAQYLLSAAPAFLNAPGSAAAAGAAGGVAASSAVAARAAASGGIVSGAIIGGATAALLGVVISTSGDDTPGGSTTTTDTTSTTK